MDTRCAGAEHVLFHLEHSGLAYGTQYFQPETYIRVAGDARIKRTFATGQSNSFTVAEMLDWLGMDLDQPIDKQPNGAWLPGTSSELRNLQGPAGAEAGTFPKLRMTGAFGTSLWHFQCF